MKRFISTILVAFFAITMMAQTWNTVTKMSPWLFNKYERHKMAVKSNSRPSQSQGQPGMSYILALVESTDGSTTIKQKRGVVWQDFGNGFCAAFLPMDSLGALDQCPSILRMEANELSRPYNDNAKEILGVDKVWTGDDQLPQAFRGNGVLAGAMDVGFDFTHPAFRNDDGTSRIVWFWDPTAENDNPEELGKIYTTSDEVLAAEHSTDAVTQNHGSHVLGSVVGRGIDGRFAGMAPEADIVGGHIPMGDVTQDFYDRLVEYLNRYFLPESEGIPRAIVDVELSGVIQLVMLYKIFKQADALDKPCVMNWSFGASSSFEYEFTGFESVLNSLLGPGRIVVASAGNEGGMMTYVKKEADKPMEQPVYYESEEKTYYMTISADIDNPCFKMDMVFEDLPDTIHIDTYEAILKRAFGEKYIVSVDSLFSVAVETEKFVGGHAGFFLEICPSEIYPHPEKMEGKIIIDTPVELEFIGLTDAKRGYTRFSDRDDINSRGSNIMTIGYPGSMERVVTVGAMNQCTTFTNILGEEATYRPVGSEEGHLVSFSSCGPTIDGRVKPDVVAPGHNILSALNSFYAEDDGETRERWVTPYTCYQANAFGKEYAMWAMSGTSMSAPIAAGIIALWLQAKPDLTPEDVMGVIERTSHQPEPEFSGTDKNVYYGWGEIDAYAGLLDILGIGTSIPELSKHQPAGVKFRLQGNTLYIDGLEDSMVNDQWSMVNVYDLRGRLVASALLAGGSVSLPADSPAGVYAVQVGKIGSTLIRL